MTSLTSHTAPDIEKVPGGILSHGTIDPYAGHLTGMIILPDGRSFQVVKAPPVNQPGLQVHFFGCSASANPFEGRKPWYWADQETRLPEIVMPLPGLDDDEVMNLINPEDYEAERVGTATFALTSGYTILAFTNPLVTTQANMAAGFVAQGRYTQAYFIEAARRAYPALWAALDAAGVELRVTNTIGNPPLD
jgi:hypothetical protein